MGDDYFVRALIVPDSPLALNPETPKHCWHVTVARVLSMRNC